MRFGLLQESCLEEGLRDSKREERNVNVMPLQSNQVQQRCDSNSISSSRIAKYSQMPHLINQLEIPWHQ